MFKCFEVIEVFKCFVRDVLYVFMLFLSVIMWRVGERATLARCRLVVGRHVKEGRKEGRKFLQ